MVEVGIRELKSRLSYYVQLMQAGETIAIKVREHVVGFLTNRGTPDTPEADQKWPRKKLLRKIEEMKEKGIILRGGLCRMRPIKRVTLKGGGLASDMIRKMRDEEW